MASRSIFSSVVEQALGAIGRGIERLVLRLLSMRDVADGLEPCFLEGFQISCVVQALAVKLLLDLVDHVGSCTSSICAPSSYMAKARERSPDRSRSR
jgi:hypothetical protein